MKLNKFFHKFIASQLKFLRLARIFIKKLKLNGSNNNRLKYHPEPIDEEFNDKKINQQNEVKYDEVYRKIQ